MVVIYITMKVLHVIPSISPKRGGPSQAVLSMVQALRMNGIEAEIATTNDHGNLLLDVPLNQQVKYKQVPIWFFPRFTLPLKEFIFSSHLTRWLWDHICDYDLIHTHYLFSYAPTCAGAIARAQHVPYIVETIGHLNPWALSQSRRKKQLYAWLIERHNLSQAAAIHCTSLHEAEDVRRFGVKTPIFTVPLGVNQPIEYPQAKQMLHALYGIPAETPVVLFLSRLHYKKRPDLLIQALQPLVTQHHPCHLLLAGNGEPTYIDYLKQLVHQLGIENKTTFTGFVTGRDKDILLQGSDLFVLPSYSENFGIAVAEAMAAGLPVIVTPDVQIASDIQQADAGLMIAGELESLREALAQLLSSPSLRQRLGENGRQFVAQRYTWKAIAQDLISAYNAILMGEPLPNSDDCLEAHSIKS